jgi:hypothetical protein
MTLIFSEWNKPAFFWPARLYPLADAAIGKIKALACLSQRHALSAQCHVAITARVIELLFPGGPSAIARLVVSVAVLAFNTVLGRWPRPHIGDKIFKGIQPTLAYYNASPAVILEAVGFRIRTTSSHRFPDPVLLRVGSAMRGLPFSNGIATVTAATQGRLASKLSAADDALDPAVTEAHEVVPPLVCFDTLKYKPSAKTLANANWLWSFSDISLLGHVGHASSVVRVVRPGVSSSSRSGRLHFSTPQGRAIRRDA